MKSLKILLSILFSIVLFIVLGIAALVLLINPNDYKQTLQDLAEKQNVTLMIDGDLSWSFYPQIGIQSGKFSIKPAIKGITKPLQFDGLTVSTKLLPLLQRKIVVDTITVSGNELTLHDDQTNNDTVIKNLSLEARGLNLLEQPFPLTISMQAITTQPPRNVAFKLKTQLAVNPAIQHLVLSDLSIQVDETHLTGKIDATLGDKPFLKIALAGDNFNVDHYFPAAKEIENTNATPPEQVNSKKRSNKSDEDLIPASSIQAFPGEYQFSFKQLTLQHMLIANFTTNIDISSNAVLTIKKLKANLYGGEYAMHGTVDAHQALPTVALNMSLKNLNLEPAMKDYLQVEKTFAGGDFGFNATISTRGLTQRQLIQSLNGDFSFASKMLTLNQVDLTSSLDQSLLQLLQVKLPKLMSEENKTVLSNMSGKGVIHNGLIDNTSLTATTLCTEFNGHGTYDLPSSAIDYRMGIIFPSSDTTKTCGDINKKLKDIAWPVLCKGTTTDEPSKLCGVDKNSVQAIVKKSAGKEAKRKLDSEIDKQLNKKLGKDADQVKQLLKGLF